ncbi:MAG: glycosyltransferase [Planctomycetaceae bacterium]|jgi:glycosyltransferase EpsF|nr:glycosyltransferase [Planctomycetaceae bacterium]
MHQLPIRILHFFGNLSSSGGAEKWFLDLMRLNDSRIHFDFLTSICDKTLEDEINSLGSVVHRVPFSRSPFPLSCFNSYLNSVRNILRTNKYDAVHVHQFDLSGEILRIAAEENVSTRLISIHSSNYDNTRIHRRLVYYLFGRRWIFHYATNILPCSNLAAESFNCVNLSKTKIIYPSINPEYFKIDNSKRAELQTKYKNFFNIPQDAIVIGHIGRFTQLKNHQFLIQLLADMIYQNEKIYAVLVGTGELFEKIRQNIIDAGIEKHVILTGKRDDVPAIIGTLFDVLVLPSLYEGLPIAAIESLAMGLNVVYSDKISQELDQFFPTRIFREKLEINNWIETILKAVKSRIEPEKAMIELINSPFAIQFSLEKLIEIYTRNFHKN